MAIIFVLLLSSVQATLALAVAVDGLRLWRAPDNTRLVFDLNGPVKHKIFTLSNPDRIVIDIASTKLNAKLSNLALADTPIKNIRTATRNGTDLRVVLDLKESVQAKSFALNKHGGKSDRLVVDLFDKYNKQVIVKSKFNGLTFSLIIGARGKIISHNWS